MRNFYINYLLQKIRIRRLIGILLALIVFMQYSCSTKKCILCNLDNTDIYNIELKDSLIPGYPKNHYITYFSPIPLEGKKNKIDLFVVDCENTKAFSLEGEEKEVFIREHMIKLDTADVEYISNTSDTDVPPNVFYTVKEYMKTTPSVQLCKRVRNDFKIELRGMLGFRNFDDIPYEAIRGEDPIMNKFIGFGEEGTKISMGFEAGFLPLIKSYNKHRLHLGLLTGYWPVDGGHYIPLAIHPRFTFNDQSSPLSGICNAMYLFGDLGTAYDVAGESDKFWNSENNFFNSYFWGLGAGVDLWKTKKMDLSFDAGFRVTQMALPSNETNQQWVDCIKTNTGVDIQSYPKRNAGQLFIRVGVTF